MKYRGVHLDSLAWELAPIVVTTDELEGRLEPVFEALHIPRGQLEAWTGIRERRWWEPGFPPSLGAAKAARRALARSRVRPEDLGVLIYAGVCRDELEPATACHVAAELGINPSEGVYDISNACLGVLNGVIDVANRIALGQIRAGLVVSCETAREINDTMIERMLESPDMETFKLSLATLTGGSGAVAVVIADADLAAGDTPELQGGIQRSAAQHHMLCRWGWEGIVGASGRSFTSTDSVAVLQNGVDLGRTTWTAFLDELGWKGADIDRVICHQVGSAHRDEILAALDIDPAKDFNTFEYLGNMGTAALPITAGIASDRGVLARGQTVAFLGIGSGLNCMMLGWKW